jgi:hypothetical protein
MKEKENEEGSGGGSLRGRQTSIVQRGSSVMNHTITTEMTGADNHDRGWRAACTCGWACSGVYLEDVLADHDGLNDSVRARVDPPPEQPGVNKSGGSRNITVFSRR